MPANIYDWIAQLKSDRWVLDIGSGEGSFPGAEFSCGWLALDDDPAVFTTRVRYSRLNGKGHQLPLRDACIDLVICHHSLEHLAPLDQTLAEMARVLKPGGRCYISVPNGYGLCDAIYRLVFLGGGHINRFRRNALVPLLEQRLDVHLVEWQKLYSSFVYLRKLMELLERRPPNLPRRLRAIAWFPLSCLGFVQRTIYIGTRVLDRWLHTDLAVYGWGFFFERTAVPADAVEQPGYVNVCIHCGSGQAAATAAHGRLNCVCGNCCRPYPCFRPFRNTL